ncbi:MAG: hypothetical protein ACLPVO_02580 [Desulfomonilaceae bacterium]
MSILALFMSILEYAIEGLWHNRDIIGILQEIIYKGNGEMLAHAAIMFVNFIPLFAIWETGRAMGDNRLFELLFKRRVSLKDDAECI